MRDKEWERERERVGERHEQYQLILFGLQVTWNRAVVTEHAGHLVVFYSKTTQTRSHRKPQTRYAQPLPSYPGVRYEVSSTTCTAAIKSHYTLNCILFYTASTVVWFTTTTSKCVLQGLFSSK